MPLAIQNKRHQSSIATNTLLNLALRITIIIIVMTGITYYHVTRVITGQSLEQLAKYVSERGESGRVIFKLAEDSHALLKQELLKRISKPELRSTTALFNKQLTRFADGTTRSRLRGFDGTQQAGTFIGKNVKIDADIQRRVLLFIELSNQYGPAWHHRLQNLYFTTPENIIVEYWPEIPNWAHQAKANYYMPDEEWVSIASKQHNPSRETVWTGMFYDQVSSLWMVSVETPVDYKGRHIATIGHDILLNDLLTRTVNERLPGSYNLIFREDGRLISHPDKIDDIKQQQGNYDIHKSDDSNLKAIYQTVINSDRKNIILDNPQGDEYLAVTHFMETNWYFVTVYPKALIDATAFSTARLILLLGLASLLLELGIFYLVLRKYVSQPLQHVMHAVNEMARGNYQVQLDDSRNDELGRIANAFNIMVSEVQQRSDALKDSEAFKSLLFESSPIGLALCDMDGALIDINPSYANIIGHSIAETKQLTYWEITPDEYAEDEQQQLENLNSKGHYGPYEKEYIHADGHRIPVRLRGQIVERNGERFIWSSVEDITEKKQAEDVLRHANLKLEEQVQHRTEEYRRAKEEAEHANQAKSEFLSSMSHELRTPLNAILGFAQLLEFDIQDEQARQSIDEILHAGKHLLNLINEVLDLSTIESGTLQLSLEDTGLNQIIFDCLKLIRPSADRREIQLVDNITNHSDHYIHVDHTRFKQVLLNLLSNAIKYNRDEGRITLEAESISAHQIRISVIDTGIGLSEQQQSRLFNPFDRGGAENSTIEGTGIGLVITKRLVELMGGAIGFASQPGQGSIFWVEVNLSDDETQAKLSSKQISLDVDLTEAVPSSGNTILYIEDNPANLRLVAQVVNLKTPHKLISAPDASLGLELAETQLPDLILMDINLPGMDGYAALNQLQANKATRHIPVIAISANAMPNDIKRAKAAGFLDYMTKPVDIQKLLGLIRHTLDEIHN